MSPPRRLARPSLAVAVSAILWGLWWIPVRALDESGLAGDRASLALYSVAALVMLPVLAWWWRRGHEVRLDRVALASGLLFGGTMVAWNHALLAGEVVRVTLLFYLAPVWASLFGFLFLGLRPTLRRVGGIALGLGGAAVILGAGLADLPLPRDASDWLALAAGAMFAGSATILSRAGGSGELERTFAAFALASLIALAAVLLAPGDVLPPAGVILESAPVVVAVVIFMLLPLSWLVIWGAGRLDPGRVAILLLFEVLAASVSAAILTDEPFGMRTYVGGALILTAAALEGLGPESSA